MKIINSILRLTTFFLVCSTLLLSCNPYSTYAPRNKHLKSLSYKSFYEQAFLIEKDKEVEIDNCLPGLDQSVFDLENIGDVGEDKSEPARRVVKRGQFTKGIPDRFLRKPDFSLAFQTCVNPKGETLMARLIKSSDKMTEKELKVFMSYILDYQYAEDKDANCLECGKLFYNFEANENKKKTGV